jgi:hypothetical protein
MIRYRLRLRLLASVYATKTRRIEEGRHRLLNPELKIREAVSWLIFLCRNFLYHALSILDLELH